MIEQEFLGKMVRRMAGLDDFPKFQPEAEGELVLICAKFARSEAHLRGVIDEVMEVFTKCPKPSELRALLDRDRQEKVVPNCIHCHGSGWRIVERDGKSGAARCHCGSVPRAPGEAVETPDRRAPGHSSDLTGFSGFDFSEYFNKKQ